eukprot:945747-Rhodomonas_salina.1
MLLGRGYEEEAASSLAATFREHDALKGGQHATVGAEAALRIGGRLKLRSQWHLEAISALQDRCASFRTLLLLPESVPCPIMYRARFRIARVSLVHS